MSSVIRILRLQSCLKRQNLKGLNGFALNFARYHSPSLSKNIFPIISSASNTRNYAVQQVQTSVDNKNLQGLSRGKSFESELQRVDTLLHRGAFLRKQNIEQILKLLIDADNVSPLQTLFLLRCCGSASSLESPETRTKLASKMWNIYEEKGLKLDIGHYNALLQVYVENENEFSPLDFLATLQEKNIEPNRITFSRLILRFCQSGDLDGANKILEFMKTKEMALNEYIFNALILGNSRDNNLEGAVGVVDIMKNSGLSLGPDTYAMLIQVHAEHNKVEEMEKLLAQFEKDECYNAQAILGIVDVLVGKNFPSVVEKIIDGVLKRERNYGAALLKPITYRLIQAGQDEFAYKLFKSTPFNPEARYQGSFFCHQLAMADLDLNKVVEYCEDIRSKGWNVSAYENALETYLNEKNLEKAMKLLRIMKAKNMDVKEHYFYPFVVNIALQNDRQKLYELVDDINDHLQVPLSSEFFAAYLLPALNATDDVSDVKDIYMRLTNSQGDRLKVYNGIVEYFIRNHNVKLAAEFVSQFRQGLYWNLSSMLAESFVLNNDAKATAILLHQMLPLSIRLRREINEEELENLYGGLKNFFKIVVRKMKGERHFEDQILLLLKTMIDEGSLIIPYIGRYISDLLGESMTSEIQEALKTLADIETFRSLPVIEQGFGGSQPGPSLRKKIEEAEMNGEVSVELNTFLAIGLIRNRQVDELHEVLEKLKSNEIALPPNVKVMLLDMYIDLRMFNEAEDLFDSITDEHPEFQISSQKLVFYARMLVEQERFEDAIKCLLINSPKDANWPEDYKPRFENNVGYKTKIAHIMAETYKKSDLATLKRMQETLISRAFAPPLWVYPSLVHYYLKEDNLEEAIATFVKVAEEHSVTVAKGELTVALIEKEDTDNIQKIMEISNQIHGDSNTLYDLVFAFVDAGKLKQAEKVLMTSGLRYMQDKLDRQCEFYAKNNRLAQLEGLISVSKNLFNVDRLRMYHYLLNGYIAEDNPLKALELWTRLQEENVDPDGQFLFKLNDFLVAKGHQVPFVVPSRSGRENRPQIFQQQEERRSAPIRAFKELSTDDQLVKEMDRGQFIRAEAIYKRGKETDYQFSAPAISRMVHHLARNGKVDEAMKEMETLLTRNENPSATALEVLLKQLEIKEDIVAMEHLGKFLDERRKTTLRFKSKVGCAYVRAGRTEELINKSMKLLDEGVSDEANKIKDFMPQAAYQLALKSNPELFSQLVDMAEKFNKKGDSTYYMGLFGHHFLNSNKEEAEKIYEAHLKELNKFDIKRICSECYHQNDVQKLEELVQFIDRNPEGREGIKGFIYSTCVDIRVKEENLGEASKIIEKSLQDIKLEHYRLNTLIDLKKRMEQKNLTFPYQIPRRQEQKEDSSSSSSSSDDEKK